MAQRNNSEREPSDDFDVDSRFKELTDDLSITLGPRDYSPPPEPEEDFQPPIPPPLPHHRTTLILSWVLAVGGLIQILVVTIFLSRVSNSYAIIGAVASLIGWILLFWHLPKNKPPHENENGAVV